MLGLGKLQHCDVGGCRLVIERREVGVDPCAGLSDVPIRGRARKHEDVHHVFVRRAEASRSA